MLCCSLLLLVTVTVVTIASTTIEIDYRVSIGCDFESLGFIIGNGPNKIVYISDVSEIPPVGFDNT